MSCLNGAGSRKPPVLSRNSIMRKSLHIQAACLTIGQPIFFVGQHLDRARPSGDGNIEDQLRRAKVTEPNQSVAVVISNSHHIDYQGYNEHPNTRVSFRFC